MSTSPAANAAAASRRHRCILRTLQVLLAQMLLPSAIAAPAVPAAPPGTWPSQAIRLVVPWAAVETGLAGSSPLAAPLDPPVVAALAEGLGRQLGRPVVLDHRPGLNGALAAEIVAGAVPDGHTFLLGPGHLLPTCLLQSRQRQQRGTGCHPQEDLAPVTLVAISGSVLVVADRPDAPGSFAALREQRLAAGAGAAGAGSVGSGSYASAGRGSPSHLAAEHLRLTSGLAAEHRPQPDLPAAMAAVRSGSAEFLIVPLGVAQSGIREGSLRGLAVTGGSRSLALPALPHLGEAGAPDVRIEDWQALWAPRQTPPALRRSMQAAVAAVLDRQDLIHAWNSRGAERGGQDAQVLELLVHSESLKWARTIAALHDLSLGWQQRQP